MVTTNNHHVDNSTNFAVIAEDAITANNPETFKTPSNLQVDQETKLEDGVILRYFIDYVKQTGDFDYRSFEVEQDLSLSPEQEQRLVRLYIDHVKRTGEFDYPMLLSIVESASVEKTTEETLSQKVNDRQEQALSSTSPQPIPSLKEQEVKELQRYCGEIQPEIIATCLSFKTLLNQWVEGLRPTHTNQTEIRLRMLMEQIPQTEDYSFLIYDLKLKHQQLAKYLNRLVSLSYKYASELDTLPLDISRRSIRKVISDLAYMGLYLEENAQVTKIQQEIFLAHDPSIYLRRLNQYLDILPDLMAYLIHAFENLMASQ